TPSAVSLSAPAFDNPECNMSAPVAMRPGIWCRRARILMVPLRRSTVRRYARAARGRPEPARPPTPAWRVNPPRTGRGGAPGGVRADRSEEHTSELQSRENLVCRLLLEKKK